MPVIFFLYCVLKIKMKTHSFFSIYYAFLPYLANYKTHSILFTFYTTHNLFVIFNNLSDEK